jgi:ribosomal protein S18 acetylase RimI-like enzyme
MPKRGQGNLISGTWAKSLTLLDPKVNKAIRHNSNAIPLLPGVHSLSCASRSRRNRIQMSRGKLRLLHTADLAGASELSRLAGWNQTIDDWEMLLRLDPQGCFAIEVDDRIVATTTLLCYGSRLAWIGMVLTRPDYRRLGFAQRLVEAALKRSAELKIETVKLDATREGQPLYEKLGFQTEQIVERWFHEGRPEPWRQNTIPRRAPYSLEIDLEAFGADRSVLLQELEKRNPPSTVAEGCCFSRSGTRFRYLGPCVAREPKVAGLMIEHTLRESPESGWYWDLLSANQNAFELAKEFGFVPQRRLERMAFGSRLGGKDELVYAIAGFELG